MTNEEIRTYYADLLILQYKGKPKAYATIKLLVDLMVMNQLPLQIMNGFNLDTAVGVQLDVLGKYAGIGRRVLIFTGPVTLSDDDYRLLIKIKIVQNNSGSSTKDIVESLFMFFGNDLKMFDYASMSIDYFLSSSAVGTQLAQAFVRQGLLPKPMGVQLGSVIYIPSVENVFAFHTYESSYSYTSGFNTYSSYATDHHWLSYDDGLVF